MPGATLLVVGGALAVDRDLSLAHLKGTLLGFARAIFGARAASIMLFDEGESRLIFEAVAGEGADELIGQRFPSSTGIAGWVLVTRQPLVVEELDKDPRFAREAAESTGFVPKGLMAAPLLHEDRALGVLEVLDRPEKAAFSLAEMELLGLFANEAAIALDLLQKARAARTVLEQEGGEADALARFAPGLLCFAARFAPRLLRASTVLAGYCSGGRAQIASRGFNVLSRLTCVCLAAFQFVSRIGRGGRFVCVLFRHC